MNIELTNALLRFAVGKTHFRVNSVEAEMGNIILTIHDKEHGQRRIKYDADKNRFVIIREYKPITKGPYVS